MIRTIRTKSNIKNPSIASAFRGIVDSHSNKVIVNDPINSSRQVDSNENTEPLHRHAPIVGSLLLDPFIRLLYQIQKRNVAQVILPLLIHLGLSLRISPSHFIE